MLASNQYELGKDVIEVEAHEKQCVYSLYWQTAKLRHLSAYTGSSSGLKRAAFVTSGCERFRTIMIAIIIVAVVIITTALC